MKIVTTSDRISVGDATALAGVVAGMALLLPVYLGSSALTVPALAVLVPSMLYLSR